MKHIAIVDDDAEYAALLKSYLERYEQERNTKLRVSLFADGDEIALNYKPEYNIILMDVEMQFMDGIFAAAEIRQVDTQVVIIFVTNQAQFAVKGYTVDALDYLLKPVSYFAFSQCLDRAFQRLERRNRQSIVINIKGGFMRLEISDIYYIEVRDHSLMYHTADRLISARGTMRELEERLDGCGFFRCSKGYFINLEHVEGYQGDSALVGGDEIPVSRARKKEFLDALNNYLNEVGT